MFSRNLAILLLLILTVVFFFNSFLKENNLESSSITGAVMGTTYTVNIRSLGSQDLELDKDIFRILNSVNLDMSTYLEDSLISILNQSQINTWINVDNNFIKVLDYAKNLCKKTDGIYDVTVGKLVNLWGFGPKEVSNIPKDKEIGYLKEQVGCDSIDINREQNLVRRNKDIALDFSSIAKGYAIDKLYIYLQEQKNILNFFIELGGEVRSTKFKEDTQSWKIGIINPIYPEKLIHTFYSNNHDSFALATSGDYRNIRVIGSKQISHTIDVKSGTPKNEAKKSISVISDNAMEADALATALNAMKLEGAIKFANDNAIKALFVTDHAGKAKLVFSNELQKVKI